MSDKKYTELYKKGISEPQPVLKPEDILSARIYKVLCICRRNCDTPDLHSFWIATEQGPLYVEVGLNGAVICDAVIKRFFSLEEASTKLALLGADLQTIDM